MRRISGLTAAVAGAALIVGAASAQGVAAGGGGVAAGGGGLAGGGVAVGGQAQYPASTPMTTPTGAPLTWVDPSQPPPGAATSDDAIRFSTPKAAPAATTLGVDTSATAPDTWADGNVRDWRPSRPLDETGSARLDGRRHAKTSSKRAAISRHERRSAPAS